MIHSHSPSPHTAALSAALLLSIFAGIGNADVPATYKGKPYGGVPRTIPGRIDFEDYDLGGVNVAWKSDDKAGQAVAPGSTAANRALDGETDHPAFWITNNNPGEVDKLPDGSLYPEAGDHKCSYIGAAHASDYANVTVNVQKAGTYWLSSHFASQPNEIKFHVSFNGQNKTGAVILAGTNSYHAWKYYRNFAHVELEAGVQVMQFYLDSYHLNWDYLALSSDSSVSVGLRANKGKAPRDRVSDMRILPMHDGKNGVRFFSPRGNGAGISILDPRGRVLSTSIAPLDPGTFPGNVNQWGQSDPRNRAGLGLRFWWSG